MDTIGQCAPSSRGTKRPSVRLRNIGLSLTAVLIAGCAGASPPASVIEGECKVFEEAEYEIVGATRQDQKWIDGNIEAGVGGCKWRRPKPRPPEWDNLAPAVRVPVPKKRPTMVQRIKQRVTGAAPVMQVPFIAQPLPAELPAAPPAPTEPQGPADPLDDLLGPRK